MCISSRLLPTAECIVCRGVWTQRIIRIPLNSTPHRARIGSFFPFSQSAGKLCPGAASGREGGCCGEQESICLENCRFQPTCEFICVMRESEWAWGVRGLRRERSALRQPSKILRLRADRFFRPPDFSLAAVAWHTLLIYCATRFRPADSNTAQLCATGVNPIDLRTSLFVFILFYDTDAMRWISFVCSAPCYTSTHRIAL